MPRTFATSAPGRSRGALALAFALLSAVGAPRAGAADLETLRARWIEAAAALAEGEILAGRLDAAARTVEAAAAALPPGERSPLFTARLAVAEARIALYRDFVAGSLSDGALAKLRAALGSAESAADDALLATARDQLGLALFMRGFRASDHAEARGLFSAALALRRRLDDRRGQAETTFHLGLTHENRRDPGPADRERARRLYQESLDIAEAGGFDYEASYAIRHLAGLRDEAGDLAGARAGFERSLELRRKVGATLVLAPALTALADVTLRLGDVDGARALYEEALEVAQRIGATAVAAEARTGLARLVP